MNKDRFEKLSNNYAEYFGEVFSEQGFSYGEFQQSIFEAVIRQYPKFKTSSILDIGCGDGESLAPFVKAGCINLTGIDLNEEMLKATKKRFGDSVRLLKADATKLGLFKTGQFDVIISGACIYNIPKKTRPEFWKEIVRFSPNLFVAAEKIVDPNPIKHRECYDNEVKAIVKVYKEKYGLESASNEWVAHYEYDEKERLTLKEIWAALSKTYNLSLVFEMGMYKTVVAVKK